MTKLALLIGVSEYERGLNPLPASVKDIQAIAKVLQHPEMGGFAQTDIQTLQNPDSQTMQEAIEALFSDRRKDDLVVFYFSGHGIKDESGKLYLATRLTRKNPQGQLIKSTSVPTGFIHDIMSHSRCKRQVVILDCCFSGAFAEGWSAKDDGSVDIYTQLGGEGRVVLTSSTSTQYSFQQEEDNLSIYTRYLIEGIETGAADVDNNGVISVDELHEYAKKKVKEAAPAMQPEIYAVKEGFKILLAKAPIGDPKLKYRKEVELFASRGEISAIGRSTLDLKRQTLGLLPEEATTIEVQVLKPYQEYQKRLQQYEQVLVTEINKKFPLRDETRNELKSFQEALGLKDEDIQPILARFEPKKIQPEIKPKNTTQRSIWNNATVSIGIFILAGVGSWMVANTLISINTPSPTPTATPTLTKTSPTSPNSPSPSTGNEPPIGTAPESFCLAEKQTWEFFKNNSGTDDASIRASMKEKNCSYWGITLPAPAPQPNNSLPPARTLRIPQPPSLDNSSQKNNPKLPSGTITIPTLPPFETSSQINNSKKVTPPLPSTNFNTPLTPKLPSGTTDDAEKIKADAAKLLCIKEKERQTILIKEGAVSEQQGKDALKANNCSDFSITLP
jgi:uncharacterized caspase-like protein